MTKFPGTSDKSVAISFKEFRDEAIVEFFANEHRSFRPEQTSPGTLTRSRIVGSPHFSKNSLKTRSAAEDQTPLKPDSADVLEENSVIRVARFQDPTKRKRKMSVEPSFGKATKPLGSLLVIGRTGPSPQDVRAAKVVSDPLEKRAGKVKTPFKPVPPFPVRISETKTAENKGPAPAAKPVASPEPTVKPEEALLAKLRETDQQLTQLIETWPRLSVQLKETISTLVVIAEKTPTE